MEKVFITKYIYTIVLNHNSVRFEILVAFCCSLNTQT